MDEQMCDYSNKIEETHWWFQGRKEILLAMIDKFYQPEPAAKVLDIGCGTGMMLRHLAKYGEIWGIDKDIKAVEYSRDKVPQAKVILGSFPETLPEEKFDLITALDVFEHLGDDEKALAETANLLKPNGIFLLTVPAYRFLWSQHDTLNRHCRRYLRAELKVKLEKAGLKTTKLSYFNTLLFPGVAFQKTGLKNIFKGFASPGLTFPVLPEILNCPLKTVFSLEKHFLPHLNFPFGVSLLAIAGKS